MRKIYQEYFYIPEQGKGVVREKVFFARLVLSIVFIVCCMFAMGYNAYAYFTANTVSYSNVIKSARYALDRSPGTIVVISNGGSVSAGANDGEYRLEVGTYDLILSSVADDINGYGRIDILKDGENTSFYTRQIVQGKPCKIRISTDAQVDIQVVACWGTYSNPENAIAEYGNTLNESPQMIYVDSQLQATKATWSEPVSLVTLDEDEPVDENVDEEETVEDNPSSEENLEQVEESETELSDEISNDIGNTKEEQTEVLE